MRKSAHGFTLRQAQGFTLIELLVVISILAILAVVGAALYSGVSKSSRDSKRKADIEAIAKAYETNYQNGSYQTLTGSHFASGTIPQDPTGGSYTILQNPSSSGFKTCAALESGTPRVCASSSANCFCLDSTQADPPSSTNYTSITNNSSLCPSTLTQNLIGYWKLDGNGQDSSIYGNNLTITNRWTGGQHNQAFNNSLNADYGSVAQTAILNPTSPNLTISVWVFVNEYITSTLNHWQTIVEGSGNLNNSTGYYLGFEGTGTNFTWRIGNGTSWDAVVTTSQTNIPLNRWVHIAATLSSTTATLYVDGTQVGTPDPHTISSISYGSYPISVGTLDYALGADHNLHGNIDDLRIYNRALSPDEITDLADGCTPP